MFLGLIMSLVILILGVGAFCLLLYKFREKLLMNIAQKITMTFWLAIIFGGLFILGNAILVSYIMKVNFAWYLQHPVVLVREGLIFFILNSFLLLACRSLIKCFSNLRNL